MTGNNDRMMLDQK